jgi:penicillin-binding protein 1B
MAKKKKRPRRRRYSKRRLRITVFLLTVVSLFVFYAAAILIYHYFDFSRRIDQRLRGEREEKPAWIYARPLELHVGQRITGDEVATLLNAIRYQKTSGRLEAPGTFATSPGEVHLHIRRRTPTGGQVSGATVTVSFRDKWIDDIRKTPGDGRVTRVELEPVPVTPLFGKDRAKQRWVPLSDIPEHLIHAVVATEDRRFFEHTGLDPVGILRAAWEDLRAQEVRQGGSTLTQQLVKNYFLTPERTVRRKLLEAFLSIILESRVSKEEILELYLNDVYLGQRGSFSINGVGQASRVFFGKDVKNVALDEAALMAALIRSPNHASPFRHPDRARKRRNVVLGQMADVGLVTPRDAKSASSKPVRVARTSVDAGEAPYFIDILRRELLSRYSPESLQQLDLSIHSTMDYNLQVAAQRAVVEGLEEIKKKLPKGRSDSTAQAALIALNPMNGDVLALVGGRSYGASQFNRAVDAHRQPGSAFKPFVYLAAFELTYEQVRSRGTPSLVFTPSTIIDDAPTTFRYGKRSWSPQNYSRRFEGKVTLRQALAKSLNVSTAKVGEKVGFQRVVDLWDSLGIGSRLEPYPSLVLGTFEVTPMELATAYAVIANGGTRVEPRYFTSVRNPDEATIDAPKHDRNWVVHAEAAFLVTDLMRSVIDQGTGGEIRARGLKADAAGKTGTTDDTRDAWFVGFTPDVLAVVWVGYDDNHKLGLTGGQAALPIWTRFMKSAVAGREKLTFVLPSGITQARIDPATGMIARTTCPNPVNELFLTGTEPRRLCTLHP